MSFLFLLYLLTTQSEAKGHILKFFMFCRDNNYKPMLYYTGHGELPTGNWCFTDDTIGIEELFNWVPKGCSYPTICSDACYSGTWAFYCCNKGVTGFECLSACRMDQSAFDTGSFNTTMNIKEGIFHGSPPI